MNFSFSVSSDPLPRLLISSYLLDQSRDTRRRGKKERIRRRRLKGIRSLLVFSPFSPFPQIIVMANSINCDASPDTFLGTTMGGLFFKRGNLVIWSSRSHKGFFPPAKMRSPKGERKGRFLRASMESAIKQVKQGKSGQLRGK